MAELVATMSYAADLGLGQPLSHCMRQTLIALRLADLAGAPAEDRAATYYTDLLMNVYCHADATEQARWFGDEITFKATCLAYSAGRRRLWSHFCCVGWPVMAGRPIGPGDWPRPVPVTGSLWDSLTRIPRSRLNSRRELGSATAWPHLCPTPTNNGTAKANRPPARKRHQHAARLAQFAGPVEVFARHHGVAAAIAAARKESGTLFDPWV